MGYRGPLGGVLGLTSARLRSALLAALGLAALVAPALLGLGVAVIVLGIAVGALLLALALSGVARLWAYESYDRGLALGWLSLAALIGVIEVKPRRRVVRALRTRTAGALAERYGDSRATYLALGRLARRHGEAEGSPVDAMDLTPFELRAFSQNGEDGVIAELVRRVGAPGRWFVEFGIEGGIEGNCVFLADVLGWSGLFIEPDPGSFTALERKYAANERVATLRAAVTPENAEELFESAGVPQEPDLLSIDVDGDDYWIWAAIERFRPRILIIEYNAALEPGRRLVQRRAAAAGSADGSDAFGASLAALVALAAEKGYRLAHTELAGVNAFFVRGDLAGGLPPERDVPRRTPNFDLAGGRPIESDRKSEQLVDLDRAGERPGAGAST